MGLSGWVINSPQGVFIEAEGERDVLEVFAIRIGKEKPARAHIQGMETSYLDAVDYRKFEIKESNTDGQISAFVIPDIATCPDCTSEIIDEKNRRYLYPFTNCTNCGPRFSIIRSLPYDRPNTTMRNFEMCEQCKREYEDPADRRFHAQPIACPNCGPHIELWDTKGQVVAMYHDALVQAAAAIRDGKIVALKGIGGFQLLTDARNEESVRRLRSRKHREEKPFALMYPSILALKNDVDVCETEERLLYSPEAPIVLLKRKGAKKQKLADDSETYETAEKVNSFSFHVAESIAPGNPYLGAMLPYTPLHHLLMNELGFPVVATSGNISDEPICIDEREALEKLGRIADIFFVHDRPIERHVDDSVVRIMMDRVQLVRRARGFAPFPVEIRNQNKNVILAVGGHLKNTIALNSGKNIFISQHVGDLSTREAFHAFEKVTGDFQNLFGLHPVEVAHDLHPDYLSTQFAGKMGTDTFGVQHHFAHIASCMAENDVDGTVLGVSWDGTGFGEDGTIWGGEFLKTDGTSYERIAAMRPFRLPGGAASVKEPRRTAVGLLFEIFGDELFRMDNLEPIKAFERNSLSVLRRMLETGLNSPVTTSTGRLFDAVSSIIGLRQTANFEGQGAMELEFAIGGIDSGDLYDFELVEDQNQKRMEDSGARKYYEPIFSVNWEPLIREIILDNSNSIPPGLVSAKFHNSLVEIILAVAEKVGQEKVVLSGGCFQNKHLTENVIPRLTEKGFKPYWHQRVPPNDGGISLGQIFVALNRNSSRQTESDKLDFGRKDLDVKRKLPKAK